MQALRISLTTWGDVSPENRDVELTTKGRYAVMAMADLAIQASLQVTTKAGAQADAAAVPLSQIAERQKLPLAYLEQLFVPLRRAGLVESARGRTGGYRLARAASEISVSAVMAAVAEDTCFTRCTDDHAGCTPGQLCITHALWQALGDSTSAFLDSVTLSDVVSGRFAASEPRAAAPVTALPSRRTYLDYNATAPLRSIAKTAMIAALDAVGNPSSVHSEGRKARGIVEGARESVARLVGAKPSEIVFTSGASEANAWVLAQPWQAILLAGIEHDSVLAPARASLAEVIHISTGSDGVARVEEIASRVLKGTLPARTLIALQMANNETGALQPVAEAAAFARAHGLMIHTDAVQAAGRIEINFATLGVDTLSLSAHKLGGPKGIGALVIRDHLDLVPMMRGGGQERRRRAGTENLAAIAGFGAAAEAALADFKAVARITKLRDLLEAAACEIAPETIVIARTAPRLANTAALALPGKQAETLVIRLDLSGIAVSAGSACSSGKVGRSHVLDAMGLGDGISGSAIRVSLGPDTTRADVDAFLSAWKTIAGHAAIAA
jgi:cysteine desulfurase